MSDAVVPEAGYIVGQLVTWLPELLVIMVGLVLLGTARMPGRAKALGFAGCGTLLLVGLAGAAWSFMIPTVARELDYDTSSIVFIVVGLLLSLLSAVGLGLLIFAVRAGRNG